MSEATPAAAQPAPAQPAALQKIQSDIEAWLASQSYKIPMEWDAASGQLFLGNRKGKTRTRFTREQLEAPGASEQLLQEARKVVEDWHRLWSTKAVFGQLPKGNQKDLTDYFGRPPV